MIRAHCDAENDALKVTVTVKHACYGYCVNVVVRRLYGIFQKPFLEWTYDADIEGRYGLERRELDNPADVRGCSTRLLWMWNAIINDCKRQLGINAVYELTIVDMLLRCYVEKAESRGRNEADVWLDRRLYYLGLADNPDQQIHSNAAHQSEV